MRTFGQILTDKLPIVTCSKSKEVELEALAMRVLKTTDMLDWPVIEAPKPGGQTVVVSKEAWEAADAAIVRVLTEYDIGIGKPIRNVMRNAIAAALLGPIEVAKAVGEATYVDYAPGVPGVRHLEVTVGPLGKSTWYVVNKGDRIALLDKEGE